ncbi:MAG: hypothetical protein MJZ74_04200 [Muribaculaceae bacterium]|nr:hypothetical protein [Muribaculaceae bacterium]
MKRLSFLILLACCMLSLAAQETIKVNYKGAKPTISDFATAMFAASQDDGDECNEPINAVHQAWNRYVKGKAQPKGEKLTVDEKNGYVVYECKNGSSLLKVEMCYWNESDSKHKLFAYNVSCFNNGKYVAGQFDGVVFYRYTNATKKMTFMQDYNLPVGTDGAIVSYELPRTGKNIIATSWFDNGTKKTKTLKWNGRRFN